jgi:hypothetical protein
MRKRANGVRKDLKSYILGNYGQEAVDVLQDLGLPVPKPKAAKTAQAKADAVKNAKATREARHTMGRQQRKAVTGKNTPAPAPQPKPPTSG